MKKHYDFSKGKRGAVLSTVGKTRVTIYLDDNIIEHFKDLAGRLGKGYQTLINETLRAAAGEELLTPKLVRQIVREEIRTRN